MNLEFEMPDEQPEQQSLPVVPDEYETSLKQDEGKIVTIEQPETLAKLTAAYEEQAKALTITDALSYKRTAALVETCKVASAHAEAKRKAIVDPLNAKVKEANATWKPIVDGFDKIVLGKGAEMSRYVYNEQQRIEREQQAANAEAARKQAKLDEEAAALRKQADEKADAGDTVGAVVDEGKAQRLELKAAQVVPQVVPNQAPRKVDLGGSTMSVKAPEKTWLLTGWDKLKPIKIMQGDKPDHRLAELLKGFDALPAGIQFLLKNADLNPVHLNKSFGVTTFPSPFEESLKFGAPRLTTAKK